MQDAMQPEAVAPRDERDARARPDSHDEGWWPLIWPAGLFTGITFFVGADMAADLSNGISAIHLIIETVALLLCLAAAVVTGLKLRASLHRARVLHRDLVGTRADLVRVREESKELLAGLRGAIDAQFQRWGLTAAQSEVALLILKGFSYKEIADLRQTTEHTARNQALAIYRKAGLSSRAEMAAFFLEDLLIPPEDVGERRSRALHLEEDVKVAAP
jgi:DNA-binding CsgD family transcriptional regulator